MSIDLATLSGTVVDDLADGWHIELTIDGGDHIAFAVVAPDGSVPEVCGEHAYARGRAVELAAISAADAEE